MTTGGILPTAGKKPTITPKAVIHQKFGTQASYRTEEVRDSNQTGCPGLAIPQKGPCLYRCYLQLPDFTVVSDICKKKKDAEQSAAEMALQKLGIQPSSNNLTEEEARNALISHVKYLFSNEFLSAPPPLSGHFRAALRRDGDLCGSVPISVIAALDVKLKNSCKIINPKVESDMFLLISYILEASARVSGLIVNSGTLSIQRQIPYPPEGIEAPSESLENISAAAVHIPCKLEEVRPVTLNVSSSGYYMDIVAQKLGLTDGNKLLVSRTIGKSSSETRLYFSIPKSSCLDLSSEVSNAEKVLRAETSLNARASYIAGQDIYGDAILASIGYKWTSRELFHEDVTLQSYYRYFLSKIPSGLYKLSREAILSAELPLAFTTKGNWRGSLPRDILCTFSHLHRLSEPVFSSSSVPVRSLSDLLRSKKKLKLSETAEPEVEFANADATGAGDQILPRETAYRCDVKIFSKSQDMILHCSPKNIYKRQNDAVQDVSLKVLSWLNSYFNCPIMHLEKLTSSADALEIQFEPQNFLKEFAFGASMHKQEKDESQDSSSMHMMNSDTEQLSDSDSGIYPSNGAVACICYSVSLVTGSTFRKVLLESNEEFEFEVGTGAVIPCLEAAVNQMSVGKSACFKTKLPPKEFIFAAVADSLETISFLTSESCFLEYSVLLLRVTEPPEERMEQALFSPPLSKQRVEYALQHIKESGAATLVDFGCGSGSLLDSLLNYTTSLEVVAGVDISQKSLPRAAKMLHTKLSLKESTSLRTAVLYEGSITDFDSRLYAFDIGTCLEVIEHMEEDQACLFGDVVLSSFRPKILILSTPNYEYNVILQGVNQEDDKGQACKFRNHDHKFEWTREQFNQWASKLAERHNYSVEFSGVGGSAGVEPGFASQIAVFRSNSDDLAMDEDSTIHQPYGIVWEWKNSNRSSAAV